MINDHGGAVRLGDVMFFLSYARSDADQYFERFISELTRDIKLRAPGAECFRDSVTIELGDTWEPKIEEALRNATCLVAMISPTYLTRPACGHEWAAFEARMKENDRLKIFPVLWLPPDPKTVPEVVKARQYANAALGDTYVTNGMLDLLRLEPQDYTRAEIQLAKWIAAAEADAPPAASSIKQPSQLAPAFGGAAGMVAMRGAPPPGPKLVDFVLVASTVNELRTTGRKALQYYGQAPDDWAPFTPEVKRLAVELQTLAASEGMMSSVTAAGPDLTLRIDAGVRRNNIIVIVIDAWSLELDEYATVMKAYDALSKIHCAAMVVWNSHDSEPEANKAQLKAKLRRIFEYKTSPSQDPHSFRADIDTIDELRVYLRKAIVMIQQRIIGAPPSPDTPAPARASGTAPASFPRLSGPGDR
jgi:FxsC-like protein